MIIISSGFSSRYLKMLLYMTILYLIVHSSSSSSPVVTFSPSSNTTLRHLAVDPQTGTVYVGAVNHIYQLDSNLTLVVDVTTGPVNDNELCADFDNNGNLDTCSHPTPLVDNYNQVTDLCDSDANRLAVRTRLIPHYLLTYLSAVMNMT